MAVQQPNAIYQAFRVTPCHNAQFVLRSRDGLFGHLSARHGIHLTAGIDSTSAMSSRESSTCTSVILAISGSPPPGRPTNGALSRNCRNQSSFGHCARSVNAGSIRYDVAHEADSRSLHGRSVKRLLAPFRAVDASTS